MKVELYNLNTETGEYELAGIAMDVDGIVTGTGIADAAVRLRDTVPGDDGSWYPRTQPDKYLPAFAAELNAGGGVYSRAKLVTE